jgi:membrane protein YdbS with pleckstrin-like domain
MYMQEGEPQVDSDIWLKVAAGAMAVMVVVLSLFASPLLQWAAQATLQSGL